MAAENGAISFIAGAVIAYMFVSTSNETIQEKTVYLQYCRDYKHNAFDCPVEKSVKKETYKVFIDRQMIVEKGSIYPVVYKSCTVFDGDNWVCDSGAGQEISMKDGDIFNSDGSSLDKNGQKKYGLPLENQIYRGTYYILSTIEFIETFLSKK
jgi:hypothetical protein